MVSVRGPDGQFISIPDSIPKEHRPNTDGPALHIYRNRSDAQDMVSKLPDATGIKTVKRDGQVQHHIQHQQVSGERGGVGIEIETTRPATVEDFS